MATFIESPRVAIPYPTTPVFASYTSVPLLRRVLVPLLAGALSISLGTLTGLSLVLMTRPADSTAVLAVSTPAVVAPAASFQNAGQTELPVPAAKSAHAPAVQAHAVRTARHRVFAFKHHAVLRFAGFARHRAMAVPAPVIEASAATPAPVQVSWSQAPASIEADAAASQFYSEGDVTVADYDASTGTVIASDGRTFIVGMTVEQTGASSWQDYRSDVHYRCSQAGACVLSRAGVIAPNARQI